MIQDEMKPFKNVAEKSSSDLNWALQLAGFNQWDDKCHLPSSGLQTMLNHRPWSDEFKGETQQSLGYKKGGWADYRSAPGGKQNQTLYFLASISPVTWVERLMVWLVSHKSQLELLRHKTTDYWLLLLPRKSDSKWKQPCWYRIKTLL